jgi:hypothetical protein
VLPFYDEVINLFGHPKFVHIGHDEVQEPGGFPRDARCKQRGAERIFVEDTLKLRARLAKSGARVMMWGDMLLAPGDSPDATNAASAATAKRMRDRLPKDIAITDWHCGAAPRCKSVGMLKGLRYYRRHLVHARNIGRLPGRRRSARWVCCRRPGPGSTATKAA